MKILFWTFPTSLPSFWVVAVLVVAVYEQRAPTSYGRVFVF
jgi:hypothetical protein